MISKIDCLCILRQHFATLQKYGEKSISLSDIFLFYIVPCGVAIVVMTAFHRSLSRSSVDFLATVFSIFIGLLLNLLVLIFDVARKRGKDKQTISSRINQVLEETFANISYSIFISVLLIIILFASRLSSGITLSILTFLAFSIVGNFTLTLLMILKRVHTLLSGETATS